MAAPTISAFTNSNFTDTVSGETSGSVSWNSGDLVVAMGVTEDNALTTFGTPTSSGSGLSFSAITGFPTNTGSNVKVYGWSATASATSSGTISCTSGGSGGNHKGGIAVWVMTAHGGLGNAATQVGDTTDAYTVSLTRAGANSAVLLIAGDWNAVSDTTTSPSPSTGSTERIGDNAGFISGVYNAYVANWADEGAAGTTSYGITGVAGAKMTLGAVEVLGTGGGATTRGTPFGHRGTAFNGGRAFHGIINRQAFALGENGLLVPDRRIVANDRNWRAAA